MDVSGQLERQSKVNRKGAGATVVKDQDDSPS